MGSFSVRSAVVSTSARCDKSACVTRKSLWRLQISWIPTVAFVLRKLPMSGNSICIHCSPLHLCEGYAKTYTWILWMSGMDISLNPTKNEQTVIPAIPTVPLGHIVKQELPDICQCTEMEWWEMTTMCQLVWSWANETKTIKNYLGIMSTTTNKD